MKKIFNLFIRSLYVIVGSTIAIGVFIELLWFLVCWGFDLHFVAKRPFAITLIICILTYLYDVMTNFNTYYTTKLSFK